MKQGRAYFKKYLWYIVGSFIYACSVSVFLTPNKISPGGVTGIASLLNYLFSWETGVLVLVINIPVLILGFVKFGGAFVINTTVVTVLMSAALVITDRFLPAFHGDMILSALFGGILMGLGISLIMLHGATTGGVDILAKIIQRRFRHFTVGRLILLFDGLVILSAVVVYGNTESGLYSLLSMYASSRILDSILYGADKGKLVCVVSDYSDQISLKIAEKIKRGTTLLDVKGGYTGRNHKMLLCTVRRYEVTAVYAVIDKIDPSAFVMVGDVGEVLGEGFKDFD